MILIALGSNLPSAAGDSAATLRASLDALAARGVQIERVSQFYRSMAWPNADDPPFVNAAASLQTDLTPPELLKVLQGIEAKFGRTRKLANAPRTLDLDILDYGGRAEPGPPELPHPRMVSRAFVLVPLRDIAPAWRHPVSGRTVADLIGALPPKTAMPERL